MIRITVRKNRNGYLSFESRGHAEYAEEGQDIVCAGASALIITTANALDAFTDDAYILEEDNGYVYWEFKKEVSPQGTLLMDALVLGLTDIQDSYDKKFLKVEIREVDRT